MTLNDILQGSDPSHWTILAGSGISIPSGLPSGQMTTDWLLRALVPDDLRKSISGLTAPVKRSKAWLRFEGINAVLEEEIDHALEYLEVFAKGLPNSVHFALAELASQGANIVTTNFDGLIERAFEELGHSPSQVCYTPEDCNDRVSDFSIFPVHGSFHSPQNSGSLAASLAKIGRTRHNSAWRNVVKEVLKSSNLLVIGYSGSDDFDVIPWLSDFGGAAATLWTDHGAAEPVRFSGALDYLDRTEPTSYAITRFFDNWRPQKPQSLAKAFYAYGRTEDLVRTAVEHWSLPWRKGLPGAEKLASAKAEIEKAFRKWVWALALTPVDKYRVAGALLMSIDRHVMAASVYDTALGMSLAPEDRISLLVRRAQARTQDTHVGSRRAAISDLGEIDRLGAEMHSDDLERRRSHAMCNYFSL